MKLCITEKPSVARDIAVVVGASTRREGFFEGGDWCVTWTFGHLCTLKEPADYTPLWKRWSLASLPMVPERFGIKLIDDAGIRRQFGVIKSLAEKADMIVNCGDAGQEGELIQRWVMQLAEVKCPVSRLWISSLTDDAIRDGFASLKPQADYDNLYHAGLCRAIGDWMLGLNATRLYSLKYSVAGKVLSIGRVQTPTLALIVQRHKEITAFKPEDFWELKTLYRGATFTATCGRFMDIEKANEALVSVTGQPLTVTDVQQRRGKESPEKLFDLTSLQVECNKRWGWSAETTLRLIQSLYEKKLTTYPRVDTTCLTDDLYPKVPGILQAMTPYAPLTAPVLAATLPKSKRVFDNSKVTDHHAIIPTGQSPKAAEGDERRLYHLIALRFIAAFYPDCVYLATTVMADVAGVGFKASGKVIEQEGWRAVYRSEPAAGKDGDKTDDDGVLPPMTVGESGPHKPSLQKKTTTPPKPYTEGTLLRAMETAGRTVDDEALREAMKANGIGRPSTRAAIIETLFKRRYISRERKNIVATQAGIELVATINEELLKSAKLTGIWENKLRRIEHGDYSAPEFMDELKAMVNEIVVNVLNDTSSKTIVVADGPAEASGKKKSAPAKPRAKAVRKLEQIKCPRCGQGHLLKGHSAYGCSRYKEGCELRLPFDRYPADLTPGRLDKMLKKDS